MALRTAKFSVEAFRSTGSAAPWASAQDFGMISTAVRLASSVGSGSVVVMSRVWSSTAATPAMEATRATMLDPGLRMRFSENTTSAAVNGVPSWNFTPRRRWKVSVR